jgi:hypothetical protein
LNYINHAHNNKEFSLKSDKRSWNLVVGVLAILAACVLSYILTQPAEADVASMNKLLTPYALQIMLVA